MSLLNAEFKIYLRERRDEMETQLYSLNIISTNDTKLASGQSDLNMGQLNSIMDGILLLQ